MAQIEINETDLLALDGLTTDANLQHIIDDIKVRMCMDEKIGTDKESDVIKDIIRLWANAGEGYINPTYVTCACCGKKSFLTLVQRGICRGMIKGSPTDRMVLGVDLDPSSRCNHPPLTVHGTISRSTLCTSCWKQVKADVRNVFPSSKMETYT